MSTHGCFKERGGAIKSLLLQALASETATEIINEFSYIAKLINI